MIRTLALAFLLISFYGNAQNEELASLFLKVSEIEKSADPNPGIKRGEHPKEFRYHNLEDLQKIRMRITVVILTEINALDEDLLDDQERISKVL